MDRDYDGRLSFGEFMGEETPLEKVNLFFWPNVCFHININKGRVIKLNHAGFQEHG